MTNKETPTEPIENPEVKGEEEEDEEEDEGDFDLCPTFCTTEVPEDVLNFVLETVSHGFGLDFIDDNDVFCDQCTEVIFGRFYHCDICNDGDFDLCVDCKEKGKHCDVKEHKLEECGEDIDDDEVDEAIRSDAGEEDAAEKSEKEGEEEDDEDDWEDEESDDGLDGESPLYVVTSLEPDVSQIKLRSRAPFDHCCFKSPFLGWTPEKIYDFWKAKLRRSEDEVSATNLSAFTFAILDEETVRSFQEASVAATAAAPKKEGDDEDEDSDDEALHLRMEKTTVLVCTDAPDFGESDSEVKLKTVRMNLGDAATAITAFELLAVCPSEFGKEDVLSVMPPPTLDMENLPEGDDGVQTLGGLIGVVGKPATPKKARENKKKAITEAEKAEKA